MPGRNLSINQPFTLSVSAVREQLSAVSGVRGNPAGGKRGSRAEECRKACGGAEYPAQERT